MTETTAWLLAIALVAAVLMQYASRRPIWTARMAVEALVVAAVLLVVNLILQINHHRWLCDGHFCGWIAR